MAEAGERISLTDTVVRNGGPSWTPPSTTRWRWPSSARWRPPRASPKSLSPLYDAGIDPDALNELFEGSRTRVEGFFSFTYACHVVTVTDGSEVTVETYRTARQVRSSASDAR